MQQLPTLNTTPKQQRTTQHSTRQQFVDCVCLQVSDTKRPSAFGEHAWNNGPLSVFFFFGFFFSVRMADFQQNLWGDSCNITPFFLFSVLGWLVVDTRCICIHSCMHTNAHIHVFLTIPVCPFLHAEVVTSSRIWQFMAESDAERDKWVCILPANSLFA
jgi:hypothetical protein